MSQEDNKDGIQWNSDGIPPMPPLPPLPPLMTSSRASDDPTPQENYNDANTPVHVHVPPIDENTNVDTFQKSLLLNRHLSQDPEDDDLKRASRRKRKRRKKVRVEHPITGEVFYDIVETEQEKQDRIRREKDIARKSIRMYARIQYDLRGEQDIAGAVHYLVCRNSIHNGTSALNQQQYSNITLNPDLIQSMENMTSSSESSSCNESLDEEDDNSIRNDPHEIHGFHTINDLQLSTRESKKKDLTSAPLLPYQLEGLMAPTDNEFDYSKLLKKYELDVGPWNDSSHCKDNSYLLDACQRIQGNEGQWNEANPQPQLQINKRPNLEILSKSIITFSKIGKLMNNTQDYYCQSLMFKSSIAKHFMKELRHGHPLFSDSMQRNLGQYLDALTCTLFSADSTHIILRHSYEFATNWELWNEISPQIRSLGFMNRQEFLLIRHELLSGNGQNTTGYENDERFSTLHQKFVYWRNLLKKFLEIKRNEANMRVNKKKTQNSQHYLDYGCVPKHENRFSQVYEKVIHESSIDVDSMNLIVAVFYGMLCRRLLNVNSRSQTDQKSIAGLIQKTRIDIEQFLDHLIKTGCRDESHLNFKPLRKILYGGSLCHAVFIRQSIIANTRTELLEEKLSKHDNKNTRDVYIDIAKKLAFHGQTYLKDNRVRIFHRIHMSTAIATLAQHLPDYAGKILKRPIFDGSVKENTPFDLIRKTLSRMDRKEDIIHGFQNSFSISTNQVHVNELIRQFQKSADIFGSLLNFKEDDLFECRCWYVAVLVGLLCLASGVHMSKTVVPALPPAQDNLLRLSQSNQQRFRHKEYCTIRLQCVRAVSSLLMLGEREGGIGNGSKFHLAITTLLEWQQASCLLAMRPYLRSSNAFYKLRCLHATHFYHLARREVSMKYYPGILDLCSQQLISKRELLSLLVLSIDKEPYEAEHWYRLAGFLYLTKDCQIHDYSHHWGERYASLWSKEGLFALPSSALYVPKQRSKELLQKEVDIHEAISTAMSSFEYSSLTKCNEEFFARVPDEIIRDVGTLEWMWPRDEPCFDDAEDYLDLVDEESGKYMSFEKDVPSISNLFKDFDMLGPLRKVKDPTRLILSKIMVAFYFHRRLIEKNNVMISIILAIRSMVQNCVKTDCKVDTNGCEFLSLCILEELNWNGVKVTSLVKEWQNDVMHVLLNAEEKCTNRNMSSWMDRDRLSGFLQSDEEVLVEDDGDESHYFSAF